MNGISAGPGRRRPCDCALSAAGAVVLALLASFPPKASAGESREPATETLKGLVGQFIALEVELGEDENRWREEKEHLETTAGLLEREKGELDRKLATAEERSGETESERERLAGALGRSDEVLTSIDDAANATGRRLLLAYDRLPEPLRQMLKGGAARLRDATYGEAGLVDTPGRLQVVAAFAADMERVLSSTHAVNQVLDLGTDGRLEVDVFYLGGAVGYFVAPGDRAAGMVVRGDEGWKVVRGDDLAPSIRRALAVHAKETPPDLVALPVPAPETEGVRKEGVRKEGAR